MAFCNHDKLTPAEFNTIHGKKHVFPQGGCFKWHIANFTEDTTKYKTILAFYKAFAIIEPLFGGLKFEGTSNIEETQLTLYFTHNGHPTITQSTPFDEGVLAHAYAHAGVIFFNDAFNWDEMSDKDADTWNLTKVAVHELLHLMFLGHSDEVADIMYWAAENDGIINVTQDTIDGIKFLYGNYFLDADKQQPTIDILNIMNTFNETYLNLTTRGLRKIAKARGLPLQGRKSQLARVVFEDAKNIV